MSFLDEQVRHLDRALKVREERIQRAERRLATVTPTDDWQTQHSAAKWAGQEVKTRQWYLQDWIPMRQTTSLYGDGGTGKSLVAQQLCTCSVIGKDFMEVATKAGPVLAWFCEDDDDELHRRQSAINAWARVDMSNLRYFYPVSRIGQDNAMMRFDGGGVGKHTDVWYEFREQVGDTRPIMAVVDTAADTFAGNENDRQQVRQYVQRCLTSIAVEFDCAVLLCAHPSKSGIASGQGDGGNTAWNNSVRSRMYLERPKNENDDIQDTDERILTRKKSNYSAMGEEMRLYWAQGCFWQKTSTSAIKDREQIARELFLELLDINTKRNTPPSGSINSATYAPRAFASEELAKDERIGRTDFERAMRWLLDRNIIAIEEQGPAYRRVKVVVRASGKPNVD